MVNILESNVPYKVSVVQYSYAVSNMLIGYILESNVPYKVSFVQYSYAVIC